MLVDEAFLVERHRDLAIVTFQFVSIVDMAVIDGLSHTLVDLVQNSECRWIVLDMHEVRFFSSQALGAFIMAKKSLDQHKGQMFICGMRPELMRLFKLTNLDKKFQFRDSTDEATRHLRNQVR